MYKTILVPVDMSHIEAGKSMIDVARKQGDKDTRIILLHVIEDIPNWVSAEIPAGILEHSRQSTHMFFPRTSQTPKSPKE